MAWGVPPKHKETLKFQKTPHDESIRLLQEILETKGYRIQSVTPYTLEASLKLGITLYSALNITRPILRLNVRADEDGNVVLNMRYEYKSGYNSTLNDLGKCKRACDELVNELTKRAS